MYDLKLIPYTNIDCLGKNVITGIVLDESENGDSVLEGLELFGLAVSGSILMTDGGSAFPSAAKTLGMNHVLCLYHFQRDIIKSTGSLAEKADQFMRDANELIFSRMQSENVWTAKYHEYAQRYDAFPKALGCIRKIFASKENVCSTYTGNRW
jgi:hypothetical protein